MKSDKNSRGEMLIWIDQEIALLSKESNVLSRLYALRSRRAQIISINAIELAMGTASKPPKPDEPS
jgi:hypothetical protein